jgi:hypothetical protein
MFKRLGEDSHVSAFERPGDQISTSTQLQSSRLKAYVFSLLGFKVMKRKIES